MSESGDYDPGPWRGYDFSSAKMDYDVHVGRSYDDAVSVGKDAKKLVPQTIRTESEKPLGIICDVTGSMGESPAVIFSKLPYLDLEGKEYLGKKMEISFAAVGDAYCDSYPLQVRPFASGKGLEKQLKELVIEGGGGGQIQESYDLAALYYARNVEMPNATNPILIFVGDEKLYPYADADQARTWAHTTLQGKFSAGRIINELQRKYSVYLIQQPYERNEGDHMGSTTREVHTQWEKYLGADHIAVLPEPQRIVDVIFGILAKETGRLEYFEEEIKGRQRPEQVRTVMKSLNSIHYLPKKTQPKLGRGNSITRGDSGGEDAPSLL